MLVEKLAPTQTYSCHFQVIGSYAREAEQTATLLGAALERRGRPTQVAGAAVIVELPEAPAYADVLLVLDEALLHRPAVRMAIPQRALLVVVSGRTPAEIAWHLPEFAGLVAAVDAESIADELGADYTAALLGAAARVSSSIDLDVLAATIFNRFDCAYPYLAGACLKACDAGYNRVRV